MTDKRIHLPFVPRTHLTFLTPSFIQEGYLPDNKMPILQFYTSPNQLTSAEKEELVKIITERYTLRLPAFFVNVMFNEVSLALFLISLSIPAQISLSSPSAISDQPSSHYPITHHASIIHPSSPTPTPTPKLLISILILPTDNWDWLYLLLFTNHFLLKPQLPHNSFFVGGKPTDGKFVRVTVDHIAMNWERGSSREKPYLEWLGGVLKERFEGRGWTWVFVSYFHSSFFSLPFFIFYYSVCVNDRPISC